MHACFEHNFSSDILQCPLSLYLLNKFLFDLSNIGGGSAGGPGYVVLIFM